MLPPRITFPQQSLWPRAVPYVFLKYTMKSGAERKGDVCSFDPVAFGRDWGGRDGWMMGGGVT